MTDEGDFLVLLLDLALLRPDNPAVKASGAKPTEILAQLLSFANAYTMMNSHNRLAIFAGQHDMCHLVHLGLGEAAASSSASVFPAACLHSRLSELVAHCRVAAAEASPGNGNTGTASSSSKLSSFALSGALSRALCLIHRLQHQRHGATTAAAAAAGGRGRPRVLCMLGSPDAPVQYIPVMNAIFSAQRAEVVLDGVVLAAEDSSFLQQAAHLTSGLYFKPAGAAAVAGAYGGAPPPTSSTALLGLLLNYFLCDSGCRRQLDVAQVLGVDFRASCFCHKYVIETGYVCSVCLSIFCAPSRACSTCGTAFTAAGVAGLAAGSARGGG